MLSTMNARAPRIRLLDLNAVIHDTHTRMPFRYGIACLTSAPSLHVQLTIEDERGRSAKGIAADGLPPRWFDKDPEKSFRQNVEDQILAMQTARAIYLEQGHKARFAVEHWEDALPRVHEACAAKDAGGGVARPAAIAAGSARCIGGTCADCAAVLALRARGARREGRDDAESAPSSGPSPSSSPAS